MGMKRLEEAMSWLTKCETYCLHVPCLGREHHVTGDVCFELGQCHQWSGSLDDSLAYYAKAAAIRVKIFGDAHPRVGNCYKCMGRCQKEHGDIELGRQNLQR